MPTCTGSSIARLVAAQSRNKCGLIGRPKAERVLITTLLCTDPLVIGDPCVDNQRASPTGRAQHRLWARRNAIRWAARNIGCRRYSSYVEYCAIIKTTRAEFARRRRHQMATAHPGGNRSRLRRCAAPRHCGGGRGEGCDGPRSSSTDQSPEKNHARLKRRRSEAPPFTAAPPPRI